MSDEQPQAQPKDAPKHPAKGETIGHIDGVPVLADGEGGIQPLPSTEVDPTDLHAWHADFVARRYVEVTVPAQKNPMTGYSKPEETFVVPYGSLRACVAMRTLGSLSPAEKAALADLFAKSEDGIAHAKDPGAHHPGYLQAEHKWMLRHIAQSDLMEKGVGTKHPAVPHWVPTLMSHVAEHAHPSRIEAHRQDALKRAATP